MLWLVLNKYVQNNFLCCRSHRPRLRRRACRLGSGTNRVKAQFNYNHHSSLPTPYSFTQFRFISRLSWSIPVFFSFQQFVIQSVREGMKEDEALIEELNSRFEKKPRKCKKINDSNIGSAERIVCINNKTFYYYPKIQEFQDLDFDKLQYVVPKAGVKLADILELKFPPRRENERNFFSITLPKNKILKFTKTLKEIIVDEQAEGEQVWTFYFDYDIVALPIKEKKLKEAKLKEIENEKLKKAEIQRLKEKEEREKVEKINEEINSLNQAEELRSGGSENEEYLRKKQQLNEREETQKRIQESDELFFHFHYRQLLEKHGDKATAEHELLLLEQVGKFRVRAEEAVREFIDELSFSPIKLKQGQYYLKNNLRLKFGEKNLNQQFLANYEIANAIYQTRMETLNWELRVPLKALVKYKGFKVIVVSMTPLDLLNEQSFDDSIVHGHSVDNWKIHFMIVEVLTVILNNVHLKPYFSEVHYQKVQIHLGSNLKIMETSPNPFVEIKNLDPPSFQESNSYKIIYLYDVDEVFPIDLDLNRSVNQENMRLRPEYIRKFIQVDKSVTNLSAGSLTYSFDDEQGEKEDIIVAKASQMLKLQEIVRFVKKLDNLDFIIEDSRHLSRVMKENGINMRYLGKLIKITQLPYIKALAEIDAIARVIRQVYRDHQREFCTVSFREHEQIQAYVNEAFNNPRIKPSMRKIRIKQLKQEEEKHSKLNAVDFLNMIFGMSADFQPFWSIVSTNVLKIYEFQMKEPQDYPHGYLLKSVLYHCDINIRINDKLKMFHNPFPFSIDDGVEFVTRSRVFDFPSMDIYRIADTGELTNEQLERLLPRLELQLLVKRALRESEAPVLLELSKLTAKIGPPTDKYTLESFLYYLYHPSPDNFETAHKISQVIFPTSHPYIMELYLEYSKIKDLDPITLKRASENHAIRNLGISHWKISEILSNFKESEYINHLIKAQAGVQEEKKTDLYLQIVKELAKYGKLYESLTYVHRSIAHFDKETAFNPHQQSNYFEILLQGIENHYITRTIQDLLKLAETFYNALIRYKVPHDSKWFYWLLYYTLKGFLESSKKKYYLFKLVLVFKESNNSVEPIAPIQRAELFKELCVKWKESRNHINHLKEMLIKLEIGFTQINYLPDFFGQFTKHIERLRNEDFNEGLKEYNDLYLIFGFKYFEQALLENVFAFQKSRGAEREAEV